MKISFPVDLSEAENNLVKRLHKRSKFYVFLRNIRHRLFDDTMQDELETMFNDKPRGTVPVPAAQLVLIALLQAYERVSDEDAIEEAITSDRWKLVLGTLGSNESPCCKKTLVVFRQRMIEHRMSNKILDKTIELARETKLFDFKKVGKLRVVFDSAPLRGAGRVEDTINLVGHGIRTLLIAVGTIVSAGWVEVAQAAELQLVREDQSVKAALDLDWNEPDAADTAITRLIGEAHQLQRWLDATAPELLDEIEIAGALQLLNRLIKQDTEPTEQGYRIKKGVAPDRIISISDPDMRHGRKIRSQVVKGYKRYDCCDLDSGLTLSACVLPANVPEAAGATKMGPEVQAYGTLEEIQIDRAFLSSQFVLDAYREGTRILSKPFPYPQTGRFDKSCFAIDLETATVQCPAGQTTTIVGSKASYSFKVCKQCPLRSQCCSPKAKHGRSIKIHEHEDLMQQLHAGVRNPERRKELRERVKIEHSLAHTCAMQGPRARYRTVEKNDYDLLRYAAMKTLFVLKRHLESPLAA